MRVRCLTALVALAANGLTPSISGSAVALTTTGCTSTTRSSTYYYTCWRQAENEVGGDKWGGEG